MESVGANDLFILGRNIYQAAVGGAWNAQSYIKNFSNNTLNIDIKKHILCGMAFEMYYDRNGLFRQILKVDNYIDILRLLESEEFQMSKNFITTKLFEETNRIVYIPASENKIELHLQCNEINVEDNGDVIYRVTAIYNQGTNIIFSVDGFSTIDDETWWDHAVSFPSLCVKLAESLLAPPDMVIITSNIEDKSNHYFSLPFSYSLRREILENQ